MSKLPKIESPDLLVGIETMDDAGVFRITEDIALVQSVDFFFPVVNDPVAFGRIVAANSMSDIWAMGAKAVTAMNVLAYPAGKIPPDVIERMLQGGSQKLVEAGVVLVGGHTTEQEELIYGMSVTGLVQHEAIFKNIGGRTGDRIVLTKPLGTGVFSNAHKADSLSAKQYERFVSSMERLNMYASVVLRDFDIGGVTDVTGFGLLGHALPMAKGAGVTFAIRAAWIPFLPDVLPLMERFNPQGACKSKEFVEPFIEIDSDVNVRVLALLYEAQTSGGLLATIRPDQADDAVNALRDVGDADAAIIGEVEKGPDPDTENPAYIRIV